jgi:hypothetical protein
MINLHNVQAALDDLGYQVAEKDGKIHIPLISPRASSFKPTRRSGMPSVMASSSGNGIFASSSACLSCLASCFS